ncbi:MAG: hypothetical protein EOO66_20980 [Methylobacterium sp.]|nr:MAG: hypothetical protein EOO66_20980 [Methylobacterium sp.]
MQREVDGAEIEHAEHQEAGIALGYAFRGEAFGEAPQGKAARMIRADDARVGPSAHAMPSAASSSA